MLKRLRTLTITLLVLIVFRALVADIYVIPTSSMQPTMKPNDKVLVNKAAFGGWVFNWHLAGYTHPKRGDIIAFFMPAEGKKTADQKTKFVKRCTGLPQDKVARISNQWTIINDTLSVGYVIPSKGQNIKLNSQNIVFYKPLIEQYEQQKAGAVGNVIYVNGKVSDSYTFQQNYYFVAGDNAAESHDSRFWGLLPESHLIGRVVSVLGR